MPFTAQNLQIDDLNDLFKESSLSEDKVKDLIAILYAIGNSIQTEKLDSAAIKIRFATKLKNIDPSHFEPLLFLFDASFKTQALQIVAHVKNETASQMVEKIHATLCEGLRVFCDLQSEAPQTGSNKGFPDSMTVKALTKNLIRERYNETVLAKFAQGCKEYQTHLTQEARKYTTDGLLVEEKEIYRFNPQNPQSSEIGRLQSTKLEIEKELQSATQEHNNAQVKLEKLTEELNNIQQSRNNNARNIESCTQEIAELERKLESWEKKAEERKRELQQKEQTEEQARLYSLETKKTLSAEKEKVANLKLKYEKAKSIYEFKANLYVNGIEDAEEKLTQLKERKEKTVAEIAQISEEIKRIQEEIQQSDHKITQLTQFTKDEELKLALDVLEETRAAHPKKLRELKETISQIEQKLLKAERKLQEPQQQPSDATMKSKQGWLETWGDIVETVSEAANRVSEKFMEVLSENLSEKFTEDLPEDSGELAIVIARLRADLAENKEMERKWLQEYKDNQDLTDEEADEKISRAQQDVEKLRQEISNQEALMLDPEVQKRDSNKLALDALGEQEKVLRTQLSNLENEEIPAAERRLQAQQEVNEEAAQHLATLKSAVTTAAEAYSKAQLLLYGDATTQRAPSACITEAQAAETSYSQAKDARREVEAQCHRIQQNITDLNKQIETLQKSLTALQKEHDDLVSCYSEYEEKIRQVQQEVEVLTQEVTTAKDNLKQAQGAFEQEALRERDAFLIAEKHNSMSRLLKITKDTESCTDEKISAIKEELPKVLPLIAEDRSPAAKAFLIVLTICTLGLAYPIISYYKGNWRLNSVGGMVGENMQQLSKEFASDTSTCRVEAVAANPVFIRGGISVS